MDCFDLLEADASAIEQHHGIASARAWRIGIRSINYNNLTRWTILEAAVQERFGWRPDYPGGFYLDGEHVRMCFPERGLIVPCRDRRGFAQALLCYRHPADDKPFWVSSAKHGGAKAVPSLHFAGRSNAARNNVVVLTRDTLTAEAVAGNAAITVAGLNGCTPSAAVVQLRAAYPNLRAVILDVAVEPALCRALRNAGLRWEAGL